MTYDFTTGINRKDTGSDKWQAMYAANEAIEEGVFPYSVADVDMKMAPEIIAGLKAELDTLILGYDGPTESYYEAVINWMRDEHQWSVEKEWILQSPGVVNAFFTLIEAYSNKGDGIIIMDPVYYPFSVAIKSTGRKTVHNTLIYKDHYYSIDFEGLEAACKDPKNKVLMFCNPHNPVGRVWSKDEMLRVADICIANDVLIFSDEIHFDLIMPGYEHTVFANLSEEISEHVVTATAPSKTFNLAGLQTSNIIIKNERLRDRFARQSLLLRNSTCNILGLKACEIAYRDAKGWKNAFVDLIWQNHQMLKAKFAERLPQAVVLPLEATYLQWIDLNGLGLSSEELEAINVENQVFLDEGYIFGESGKGFERIHIATPTAILEEGLDRMIDGLLNKIGQK